MAWHGGVVMWQEKEGGVVRGVCKGGKVMTWQGGQRGVRGGSEGGQRGVRGGSEGVKRGVREGGPYP